MDSVRDRIAEMLLTPLSWIYGAATELRNKMFDWNLLRSYRFDVPVVCVGNISVGGTGKTPHVEYIVSRLSQDFKIGVVSRGYRRKTKGFVLATSHSTPDTIGDEAYQIYRKFGRRIRLAVCESRRKGIEGLLSLYDDIDLMLLDDGFQHRYVEPSISLLLMDYTHPFYEDTLLPLGTLRESRFAINRADYVIVTKCPSMTPLAYSLMAGKLDLMSYQKLFFSKVAYDSLEPVFEEEARYTASLNALTSKDAVLLVTGIARPRSLVKYVSSFPFRTRVCHFPDHHSFGKKDLARIQASFAGMKGSRKIILTTEKDAVRMINNPYFPHQLKPFCFYLPIRVDMMEGGSHGEFIEALRADISSQIRKNKDK